MQSLIRSCIFNSVSWDQLLLESEFVKSECFSPPVVSPTRHSFCTVSANVTVFAQAALMWECARLHSHRRYRESVATATGILCLGVTWETNERLSNAVMSLRLSDTASNDHQSVSVSLSSSPSLSVCLVSAAAAAVGAVAGRTVEAVESVSP